MPSVIGYFSKEVNGAVSRLERCESLAVASGALQNLWPAIARLQAYRCQRTAAKARFPTAGQHVPPHHQIDAVMAFQEAIQS
ncbi:MAG: hypothetical protein AAF609_15655 [Cyanobacteria bacterium P01_C01_bin.120]